MPGHNFNRTFDELFDKFISEEIGEEELCSVLTSHGLTPGQLTEELDNARNARLMVYARMSVEQDYTAQRFIEGH